MPERAGAGDVWANLSAGEWGGLWLVRSGGHVLHVETKGLPKPIERGLDDQRPDYWRAFLAWVEDGARAYEKGD